MEAFSAILERWLQLTVQTLQGPNAQSLIMVITCSRSAIVQTLGQHRPDEALLWKLSVLFWKGGCS